jgi:SAM-dependent methyltransferase
MPNMTDYLGTLELVYSRGTNNHPEHNTNPLYWDVLLGDIKNSPDQWTGKVALDFGCGKGRNVTNLKLLANFERVDGVDISQNNIDYCIRTHPTQSTFYKTGGDSLAVLSENTYDFVMSTIVFQHLCVHELRVNLKKEVYRVMKPSGIFSFQMGYGPLDYVGNTKAHSYYENAYTVENSNGSNDVRVSDPRQLIDDLEAIGFTNVTYRIEQPWADGGHPNWIYIRCEKP